MSTHYKFLPLVYDRWQQSYGRDFSSLILPRLLLTIRKYRIRTSSMLDLACGTGTLAIFMARRGWRVYGVDGSGGMIAEAEKKLRGRKLDVIFLRKDMRKFVIPVKVGLATSFFDSLNHLLSTRDLLMTFRRVHTSLEEGAYFIFDVNNEHCYRTVWRQTEAIRQRDFALVLNNCYDPDTRLAEANVSIMVKGRTGEEEYRETVRERWYPREEIKSALQEAGFQVRTAEDFNFTHNSEIGDLKTWWVAQK